MSETGKGLGAIAQELFAEICAAPHPDARQPTDQATPPNEEQEPFAEILRGAAAEVWTPKPNKAPTEAMKPGTILETLEGVLAELFSLNVVKPTPDYHIPAEVSDFFKMNPEQTQHLARQATAPLTAEQRQPETEAALEDLLKDLACTHEMVRDCLDCDNPLLAEGAAASWRETLETIHTFSPTTAMEPARSTLEDKDTPPCLRVAASDYVHSHIKPIRLTLLAGGIKRHAHNPDSSLGHKQGLCDLLVLLEDVVDRPDRDGETVRLRQQIDGEVRQLCKASASSAKRAPLVS
ncbi:MAG: hypothetical protein PHW63_01605 [Alphaproteobacteria bacterium]|nr:hypothetical protein [Alphaproteobacteria bacterium]